MIESVLETDLNATSGYYNTPSYNYDVLSFRLLATVLVKGRQLPCDSIPYGSLASSSQYCIYSHTEK